jgi:hypothetical protein
MPSEHDHSPSEHERVEQLLEPCLAQYPPDGPGPPGGYVRPDGKIERRWHSGGKRCVAVFTRTPTIALELLELDDE